MPNRLVVVGLDAADYDLARPWIESGELPILAGLSRQGLHGRLTSTKPPETPPAWTSITTGMNPGGHGVFSFWDDSLRPVTALSVRSTRLWDYVGLAGGRSVVVNVPVTYPASIRNGVMVAGIPHYTLDEGAVSPKSKLGEIGRHRYEIDSTLIPVLRARPQTLLNHLFEIERRRIDTFLDLLREESWDFAMVVVTALDRIQHAAWKGEDPGPEIRQAYRLADELVGKVVRSLDERTFVMVVSDHGFGYKPLAFHLNVLLGEMGLVGKGSRLGWELRNVLRSPYLAAAARWGPTRRITSRKIPRIKVDTRAGVDEGQSRAFAPGTDGIIFAASDEVSERIAATVTALRGSGGENIVSVHKREEVYHGAYTEHAPRLVVSPGREVSFSSSPFGNRVVAASDKNALGNHTPNGLFILSGAGIPSSPIEANAIDVTPTALWLMRIDTGAAFDGEVVPQIAGLGSLGNLQRRTVQDATGSEGTTGPPMSAEEERQLTEHLRDLGYT